MRLVLSDDPSKIFISLLSYKEQYWLSTMPRGAYNIKYKIVLTLHYIHWRMFDCSRRLHYKHPSWLWSKRIVTFRFYTQLPKKQTYIGAVARTRFACVTSKANKIKYKKTQKPTFNPDSEEVSPGTPSMLGRPDWCLFSSTGVKTIWGADPVCRLSAFSRLA